jgi:MFS family permease
MTRPLVTARSALLRPDLLQLWASLVASWAAWSTSQVVLSWIVLARTNSAFDVGLLFAARMLPMTVAGIPLGLLADRHGRRRLLVIANVMSGVVSGFVIVLATLPQPNGDAYILGAAVVLGLLDAARIVASQSLTYDLAGPGREVNALAIANLLSGVGGAVGGLAGGVTLAAFGAAPAAALIAGEYLVAAIPLLSAGDEGRTSRRPVGRQASSTSRFDPSLRLVMILAALAITVEIFGFSSMTLDSVFAVGVFSVGAFGLGLLTTARSLGRFGGALFIAVSADRFPPVSVLILAVIAFGGGLIGFASSGSFAIAILFMFITGAAGAAVDSLVQVLLQRVVHEQARGRAVGVWVVSIGLAPVGAIELGYIATKVGPQPAQLLNGAILTVVGFGLAFASPLRQLQASHGWREGSQPETGAGESPEPAVEPTGDSRSRKIPSDAPQNRSGSQG